MNIRDRIVELRRVKASELAPSPLNWRKHPERQANALRGVLSKVGWADAVLARKLDDGRLELIDGHLRAEIAPDSEIPVLVLDVDETEAKLILTTHDTITELADVDQGALDELVAGLVASDSGLEDLLASIMTDDGGGGELGDDTPGEPWQIYSMDEIIEAAFEHYRQGEFPYRTLTTHEIMQEMNKLAALSPASCANSTVGYTVADNYHKHRFHAAANGRRSPVYSFSLDESLRRAIKLTIENGNPIKTGYFSMLTLVLGTQACSNFRPPFAMSLYREFCPDGGAVVLDTSTGYGGRLVGAIASGVVGKYIGIDPNAETHNANVQLARDLGFESNTRLLNRPAEDVTLDELASAADFAFTSPPYFSKEIYSDDPLQSCNRYSTGEEWRDSFLRPMLQLQWDALKPGAFNVVNIADVKIGKEMYPLEQWVAEIAIDIGFEQHATRRFRLSASHSMATGGDESTGGRQGRDYEPVFVFEKAAT